MSAFRYKASREDLTATEIGLLRRICTFGVAEIRSRAKTRQMLLDVPILSGDWPASKATVLSLLSRIEAGELPLSVFIVHTDISGALVEEQLTLAAAHQHLRHIREISLEQDMLAQLEQGYISSQSEYEPLPDDEA